MPRYGRVVLGGTFDRLHAGHEALLATAFRLGRTVAIGLTSARFLASHPKPRGRAIGSEPARRAALRAWLRQRYPPSRWSIVALDEPFGGSVEDGVDALVVSADTAAGGQAVNRERRRRGRAPVPLIVVPLVLADDLEPLSSRRIRAGEVDRRGHRSGPFDVGLAVEDDRDREAARRGVRRAFPRARVRFGRAAVKSAASAVALGRLAERARGRRPLGLAVGRRVARSWPVAVRGRHIGLPPQPVRGRTARDLEAGVARLLRPRDRTGHRGPGAGRAGGRLPRSGRRRLRPPRAAA